LKKDIDMNAPAIILAAVMALCAASASAKPERVTEVHDGDSFRLADRWTPYALPYSVRLLAIKGGIDTPEIGKAARCEAENSAAIAARDFARAAIEASGWTVWLRRVSHDRNGGRILADALVKVNGRKVSLGDMLIKAGHAVRYDGTSARMDWCHHVPPVDLLPPSFTAR
jgi:endonuclease YncB( thermonuclease family)